MPRVYYVELFNGDPVPDECGVFDDIDLAKQACAQHATHPLDWETSDGTAFHADAGSGRVYQLIAFTLNKWVGPSTR